MEHAKFSGYIDGCIDGVTPACERSCPFSLQTRDFIAKMRAGNFESAYRLYREAVLFPEIVSRLCGEACRGACALGDSPEGGVRIRALERASVAYGKGASVPRYRLPGKDKSVAVIGAGPSGMACALALARRKYRVTVYERGEAPGGILRELLDADVYREEFRRQFADEVWSLEAGCEVTDIRALQAYDAVYIATGRGGNAFLAAEALRAGAFRGGMLVGGGPAEAIAQGIDAAAAIDAFLKTGALRALGGRQAPVDVASADAATVLSEEAAAREAARCVRCDCKLCQECCELLRERRKTPRRAAEDIVISLNPVVNFTERVATRMILGCSFCGTCQRNCPAQIDLGEMFQEARYALYRQGGIAPVFHDYWMRDMQNANGDAWLMRIPGEGKTCGRVFFTGCQLPASLPETTVDAYRRLLDDDPTTGILLGCCGVPAAWAGDEETFAGVRERLRLTFLEMGSPEIITGCPACRRMLQRSLPEFRYRSVVECLAGAETRAEAAPDAEPLTVFDPCAAQDAPEMRTAARALVTRAGYRVRELAKDYAGSDCCGFGGHIYPANPDLMRTIAGAQAARFSGEFVTYCSNCRDVFLSQGRSGRHILELLAGKREVLALDPSARRQRRLNARARILALLDGEPSASSAADAGNARFRYEAAAEASLVRELLLRESVERVVQAAEESGRMLLDTARGRSIAHGVANTLTVWVEYAPEGDAYRVYDVYCHRMTVEEKAHGC